MHNMPVLIVNKRKKTNLKNIVGEHLNLFCFKDMDSVLFAENNTLAESRNNCYAVISLYVFASKANEA